MGMPTRQVVEIRDFPGIATRPDSLDTQPGAAIRQENVQSSHEGKLRSRQGLDRIRFEEE